MEIKVAVVAAARKILLRASYVPYYCCTRLARGEACGAPWKCNHPGAPRRLKYFTAAAPPAIRDRATFPILSYFRVGWLHVYIQLQFYRLSVRHFILLSGCYLRPHVRFLVRGATVREKVLSPSYSEATMPIQVGSFFYFYYCAMKCYKLRWKVKAHPSMGNHKTESNNCLRRSSIDSHEIVNLIDKFLNK